MNRREILIAAQTRKQVKPYLRTTLPEILIALFVNDFRRNTYLKAN